MADPIDTDAPCRQIANGPNPIVVCERSTLLDEVDRLRAERDALAALVRDATGAVVGGAAGTLPAWWLLPDEAQPVRLTDDQAELLRSVLGEQGDGT